MAGSGASSLPQTQRKSVEGRLKGRLLGADQLKQPLGSFLISPEDGEQSLRVRLEQRWRSAASKLVKFNEVYLINWESRLRALSVHGWVFMIWGKLLSTPSGEIARWKTWGCYCKMLLDKKSSSFQASSAVFWGRPLIWDVIERFLGTESPLQCCQTGTRHFLDIGLPLCCQWNFWCANVKLLSRHTFKILNSSLI